jgi:hypothetical protein
VIVTTHPDRLATAILEALSEAGSDYAVTIGPSPTDGYLIELHDLAERTETPVIASGENQRYAIAVAELVVNLLVDRREALELELELEHQADELDLELDPTPPHGVARVCPLETRAAWTGRAS